MNHFESIILIGWKFKVRFYSGKWYFYSNLSVSLNFAAKIEWKFQKLSRRNFVSEFIDYAKCPNRLLWRSLSNILSSIICFEDRPAYWVIIPRVLPFPPRRSQLVITKIVKIIVKILWNFIYLSISRINSAIRMLWSAAIKTIKIESTRLSPENRLKIASAH